VQQLVQYFASYLYLPRLTSPEVLVRSIRDGLSLLTWQTDTFGYAESYDEAAGRYRGLRSGEVVHVTADDTGLLVHPSVAREQLDREVERPATARPGEPGGEEEGRSQVATLEGTGGTQVGRPTATPLPRRFHGTVELNPARVGRDASQIADEVIAHLAGLVGAEVRVTLEVEAHVGSGVPDQVVRTVTENSSTLKFTSHGFETE
jgi:hypothetical protein